MKFFVTKFVDDIIESGEADMTSVIGVPAIITVDWLGLPIEHWERYASAFHALLVEVQAPRLPQGRRGGPAFLEGVTRQIIAARRAEPQDDIISYLVKQEVDERPVTDDEVFAIVDLLLSGGVGTTASLVSNTVVWLYQNQEVRQDLIEHPEKLQRAIEEFLRFFSPTQGLARTVTKDVEFEGCPMQKATGCCSRGRRPTATPSSSRTPTRSTSSAGRTATPPSASASTGARDRTSAGRWPTSC